MQNVIISDTDSVYISLGPILDHMRSQGIDINDSNKNKIILNERLIEKSKDCIEYVVFHELAHLRYPNHSKDFYNYLTELMPEWKVKKLKLNERH